MADKENKITITKDQAKEKGVSLPTSRKTVIKLVKKIKKFMFSN